MAGKSGASAPADRAEFDSFAGIPSAGIAKPPLQGYAPRMFAITEADTDAILAAFDRDGEPAAVVELRPRFPGRSENAGLEAARMIVRWRLSSRLRIGAVCSHSCSDSLPTCPGLPRSFGGTAGSAATHSQTAIEIPADIRRRLIFSGRPGAKPVAHRRRPALPPASRRAECRKREDRWRRQRTRPHEALQSVPAQCAPHLRTPAQAAAIMRRGS